MSTSEDRIKALEDEIRRIDGNLQNITGRRKEVDDRLDVVKKQAGDLLGILNTYLIRKPQREILFGIFYNSFCYCSYSCFSNFVVVFNAAS